MIEDMSARQLSAAPQKSHIRACKRFAAFLKRSPETATADDIRRIQLHLAESDMSICHRNRTMTGLQFLFRVTLRRLDLAEEIYHIKEPQRLPLVHEPGRDQPPVGSGKDAQSSRVVRTTSCTARKDSPARAWPTVGCRCLAWSLDCYRITIAHRKCGPNAAPLGVEAIATRRTTR